MLAMEFLSFVGHLRRSPAAAAPTVSRPPRAKAHARTSMALTPDASKTIPPLKFPATLPKVLAAVMYAWPLILSPVFITWSVKATEAGINRAKENAWKTWAARIDHIHMLVSIPPKYSVSEVVGYLKGKSSLMIFEKHANLKYKYGNRHFWCRGYYVDTVGKNTAAIKAYIQNQIKEDLEYDQMSLVEYIDPFTGEPVKKNKK